MWSVSIKVKEWGQGFQYENLIVNTLAHANFWHWSSKISLACELLKQRFEAPDTLLEQTLSIFMLNHNLKKTQSFFSTLFYYRDSNFWKKYTKNSDKLPNIIHTMLETT